MVSPMGSEPSKSSSTMVWPMTATMARSSTCSSVNISPLSMGHWRIWR
jgi:hypothetical protein